MGDFWDSYVDSLGDTSPETVRRVAGARSAKRTLESAVMRDIPVTAQGAVDLAQRPFQRADVLREMGVDPAEYANQAIRDPRIEEAVEARLRELSDAPELAEAIDTSRGYTPREAQTPGERIASDAVVGGALGLATAPLGGGVAAGVASGALGGAASGSARELGLGGRAQFAAGTLAGATPAAVARGPFTGPVGAGLARRATGAAASEAMDEAASILRGISGVDDATLAARVAEERAAGPGQASLAQLTGSDAAAAAEGRAVSANPEVAERILTQRRSSADALRQAESDLYAGGTDPGEGLRAARATSKAGVDAAYKDARRAAAARGDHPVSARNTLGAASDIAKENSAFLKSRIPAEAGEVLGRFGEAGGGTLLELDNLSRSLTQTLKDLGRAGDDQGVRLATILKEAVDADFLAASTTSGAAQKFIAAKGIHADHAELFSLKHPSVSALLERTGVGNAVRSREAPQLLASLRKKPSEAFRLRRALAQDPDALEGAKRLALNDLLGGKPLVGVPGGAPGVNVHAVLRDLERPGTQAALRGLLGDPEYEGLATMLRRTRQLTTMGSDVSPRQAFRILEDRATNDGAALATILVDAGVGLKAPVVRGVVREGLHLAGWPRRFYNATTQPQRAALVEKALLGDLDTIELLLARPKGDAGMKVWNQKLQTALAALDTGRSAVRQEIQEQRP